MNLEKRIRAAFAANPKIHTLSLGVCTAHKSPGNFAAFRDRKGDTIHVMERSDALDALVALCDHVCERPAPPDLELPELPMMTTRAPELPKLP